MKSLINPSARPVLVRTSNNRSYIVAPMSRQLVPSTVTVVEAVYADTARHQQKRRMRRSPTR